MFSKLRYRYSQYGITVRIVVLFVFLVIIPFFAATALIAVVFRNYSVSSLSDTTLDTMMVVGNQIKNTVREYEEDTMALYYNGSVELLGKEDMSEQERRQIESSLISLCFSDTHVHAMYLVTEKETFHSGSHYNKLFELMEPFRQELVEAGGACLWYPTNQLLGQEKENKYILARSLNSKEKKNVGILYMVLDDEMISKTYDQLRSQQIKKYLTTESGKILYTSESTQFGKTLDISSIAPNMLTSCQRVEHQGEKAILVSRHLMDTDWYCIGLISIKDTMRSIMELEKPFILLAFVYVIFLFLMLQMMRRYVFQPLRILKNTMDHYAQGEIEPARMESIGYGEFRSLSRHFNDMTVRISDLMERYRNETDEKNRQRMKALTAQLTPHFIYNALNTIKWMAVLNHQDNIQHLTESLTHIFMNAAKVDDENYTLQDELNLVSNYAVIQRARFMNFELEIETDEECKSCNIRKFLLQPIVENAIVHGLGRGRIKNTTIRIKAWVDRELHISVQDEGVGFDVKKWRDSPDTDKNHTNIGLNNVEQIILLEYGQPYHLDIESEPGKGTTIRYYLPVIRKGGK